MSYLQDKKIKRRKFWSIFSLILFLLIIIYFRAGIYRTLAFAASSAFRPVLIAGDKIGDKFGNLSLIFRNKSALKRDNDNLRSELDGFQGRLANYEAVLGENEELKEILGRKKENRNIIIAAILAKPSQSAYDTLLLDVGGKDGVREGNRVFGRGDVPLGRVAEVYPGFAKVVLFSSPGEKTEVALPAGIFMELVGRGGGNFEIILPRDLVLPPGAEVVMRGINPYPVAIVEKIISDPRDSFQKALLSSPANIQELKFVEVEL